MCMEFVDELSDYQVIKQVQIRSEYVGFPSSVFFHH